MLDTKAQIIHQILKLDRPFKVHNIYEETGLSAQNTSNHLRRLVDKGILLKQSTLYLVVNKEALIDELISATEGKHLDMATDVLGLEFSKVQDFVDNVVRARVLEIDGAVDAHVIMNRIIDDMAEQVKLLKRWLNTKTYTKNRAEPKYSQDKLNLIFEVANKYGIPTDWAD